MALRKSSGKALPTIAEAARHFHVSRKTVREWIRKGVISAPAEVEFGSRLVQVFPPDYLAKASHAVKKHREEKKARRRRGKVRKR